MPEWLELEPLQRATHTECPLGELGFVEKLEIKFQVRLRPLPPGPPAIKPAQTLPIGSLRRDREYSKTKAIQFL